MQFEIQYQSQYESLDDIATLSKFKIVEYLTYDDATIEHTFENGLDMIEYIDNNKMLSENNIQLHLFNSILFDIMKKYTYTGLGF